MEYTASCHLLPVGNRNLVKQLQPTFGQVDPATGAVSDVYRCPSDRYIQASAEPYTISFAPTENDTAPKALLHCPWSLFDMGRYKWRGLDEVAADTVLLLEYWHGANRANPFDDKPGWVRGTLDWAGPACPEVIPSSPGSDVGGYLFLKTFDAEAEGTGKPWSLRKVLHSGLMNAFRADGAAVGIIVREHSRGC